MTRKRPLTLTLRRRTRRRRRRGWARGGVGSGAKWGYRLGGLVLQSLVNSDSMEAEEEPDLQEYLVYYIHIHIHIHIYYMSSYI
jgi:hypothetical protein